MTTQPVTIIQHIAPTSTRVRPDDVDDDLVTWNTAAGELAIDTSNPNAGPQILLDNARITRGAAEYLRDALITALATPDPALEKFSPTED